MPALHVLPDAVRLLTEYRWHGNGRKLKNITEQISIIENVREIPAETLAKYLPNEYYGRDLPVLYHSENEQKEISERDLLYKVLFDMKKDINDLKQVVGRIINNDDHPEDIEANNTQRLEKLNQNIEAAGKRVDGLQIRKPMDHPFSESIQESEVVEESLSIQEKEIDLIKRALARHNGKRKNAAGELGISERTLYRTIKEYNIG